MKKTKNEALKEHYEKLTLITRARKDRERKRIQKERYAEQKALRVQRKKIFR